MFSGPARRDQAALRDGRCGALKQRGGRGWNTSRPLPPEGKSKETGSNPSNRQLRIHASTSSISRSQLCQSPPRSTEPKVFRAWRTCIASLAVVVATASHRARLAARSRSIAIARRRWCSWCFILLSVEIHWRRQWWMQGHRGCGRPCFSAGCLYSAYTRPTHLRPAIPSEILTYYYYYYYFQWKPCAI